MKKKIAEITLNYGKKDEDILRVFEEHGYELIENDETEYTSDHGTTKTYIIVEKSDTNVDKK